MSEKDVAKSKENGNLDVNVFFVLIIVAVITGVADYFRGYLGTWYSQNWIIVTIGVGVSFPLWFFIFIWIPATIEGNADYKREEELKKAIIRKKILKEKSKELDSLNLTQEEREYQIRQWVEKAYTNEILGKYTSPFSENELESEVGRVPPLSQRDKEIMISKVGTRCCYPNCGETISLEVHHIIPRSEGGINKENNLIVLCNNHHHLADRGAIPRERLKAYCVATMKEDNL
jgi:5-methylcytosine-specific restriction endonuclease McrA